MEQTTAPLVSKSNLRDSSADPPLRFHGLMLFMSLICPYMDSPSLQAPFPLAPVPTAHVYSAFDICIVSMRAMMGYSRAGSQSLLRASRTWTFEGFSSAGSTGLPSFRLLRNRG